jgi:hypothetical protein
MNIDDLSTALREITQDQWGKFQQPILLSDLPSKLQEKLEADYKEIIGGKSLKSFIQNSGTDKGYRLVEHPTQRARLGLVPDGIAFEFSVEETKEMTVSSKLTKQDIDGFVKVLECLSPEELRRVSLPASLFVKLLSNE